MTRIVAGRAKGRRLTVPPRGTRPTSDRVREAIFSAIDASLARDGRSWSDVAVADLYAGSGALGFEAWSRGAASVTLVESAKNACRILRENRQRLDATTVSVECADVKAWVARATTPIDVCFLDPPYSVDDAEVRELIASLRERELLNPLAHLVAERAATSATSPFGPDFIEVRERTYGDTRVWYGQFSSHSPAEGS
jgi:16S rRNA (guanine966-N2)-methyltransferase